MKKIIALCLLLLTLLCCPSVFADRPIQTGRKDYEMVAPESYEGRKATKVTGKKRRAVVCLYPLRRRMNRNGMM